jgi:retron-type reverse transcriptase
MRPKTSVVFLKLDIRKYFDAVDHLVLREQLRRLIKSAKRWIIPSTKIPVA